MDSQKQMKLTGYVNLILLICVAVYETARLVNSNNIIVKMNIVVSLFAYIFGIFYAFKGYKKNAAQYYKTFMLMFSISTLLCSIVPFTRETSMYGRIIGVVCFFYTLPLVFIKDLGKEKSLKYGQTIALLRVLQIITKIGSGNFNKSASTNIANLMIAATACAFITAKYKDKEARNTK